ncbi:unnamed protein product [Rhizoctonia solani]|uniref:Uncharacterized protein n=1 Tax=Rhizoctonia solani TaxID=456999 RepID=A0A8H2X8V6_9AGAM|nr:unnamed protein product [Rhizoctonia solani]
MSVKSSFSFGDDCAGSDISITRAESCITSAMALAARTDELSAWAHEAKLDLVIKTVIPSGTVFEPIRNLQAASTKFPDWLKTPDSPEYGFLAPNHRKWRDRLCSTLQQSGFCYSFGRNWEADLPYAVLTIFPICHHLEAARLSNRDGAERLLRLPDCTTDRAKVATTTVDGAIAIRVVDFEQYVSNLDLQHAASAIFKNLFSGENQMKMAMVSALHQKKVLGTRTQFVFGIFQYNRDFFQVNAGCWIIKIYRVGRFSLQSPAALVQFYILLREIKQLARLSPVLASLGQWDTDDRINSFSQSVGSYDFNSGDDPQVDIS